MGDKIGTFDTFDNLSESSLNEGEQRILFDQDDFEKLVSGGIVEKGNIKIALKDIGYDLMLDIISELKSNLK